MDDEAISTVEGGTSNVIYIIPPETNPRSGNPSPPDAVETFVVLVYYNDTAMWSAFKSPACQRYVPTETTTSPIITATANARGQERFGIARENASSSSSSRGTFVDEHYTVRVERL
jgi:hypothetical protein